MNNGYQKLIDDLVRIGYLKSSPIIHAFRKNERKYFVPKSITIMANVNNALPLGSGQTISQPLTVAFMLELLKPKKGNIILEIGSGSSWQTAILASIVGKKGHIYACEIIESLANFGRENIKRFHFSQVTVEHRDASQGYCEKAPYDRIISGAAFEEIPDVLKEQLKVDGILVTPTQQDDIRKIVRLTKSDFKEEIYPGFAFVPITSRNSHL